MKNLKTLVLMQLKDKIDFSFIKSVKATIFKVVLNIIKSVFKTDMRRLENSLKIEHGECDL